MPGARSAIAMGGADVMTFVRSLRPGFPKGLKVVLVTEDETTFSESKEVLESLCYEGECIVSSRVVVTRAFTKRIFRLNFG